MANPNLLGIGTVTGITTNVGLTTSFTTILSNANSSNKVFKIINIFASHVSTSGNNSSIDVNLNNSAAGAGSSTGIVRNLVVPSGATQIILDKNNPIYLQENKSIVATASSVSHIDLTIVYEDIQ